MCGEMERGEVCGGVFLKCFFRCLEVFWCCFPFFFTVFFQCCSGFMSEFVGGKHVETGQEECEESFRLVLHLSTTTLPFESKQVYSTQGAHCESNPYSALVLFIKRICIYKELKGHKVKQLGLD